MPVVGLQRLLPMAQCHLAILLLVLLGRFMLAIDGWGLGNCDLQQKGGRMAQIGQHFPFPLLFYSNHKGECLNYLPSSFLFLFVTVSSGIISQ
jgi:hypothetical protein